jgi:hypothetical protein
MKYFSINNEQWEAEDEGALLKQLSRECLEGYVRPMIRRVRPYVGYNLSSPGIWEGPFTSLEAAEKRANDRVKEAGNNGLFFQVFWK